MGQAATNPREQAHALIDLMPPRQISALVGLLRTIVDPVARALANAPIDDEPVSEEEKRDILEARAAIARGEFVSHEEVLAEFGLTTDDLQRVGNSPPESNSKGI